MNEYQYIIIFATSISLITGGLGWIISWVRAIDRKASQLETDVAVIKAVLEERK